LREYALFFYSSSPAGEPGQRSTGERVQRIELVMSVLAGISGGLIGGLWGGVVSSPWIAHLRRDNPDGWKDEKLRQLAAVTLAYGAAGATLGFLFWLGWGLVALIDVDWYLIGLLFGLLCWAGATLPVMVTLWLRLHTPATLFVVHAVEWLVACLAIGLLCAQVWERAG
jgi:hypothetical protein